METVDPKPNTYVQRDSTAFVIQSLSNQIKIGIVGLPNVGKSTLFSVLADKDVSCENFPFCTVEMRSARVTLIDTCALVRGSYKGEGLGSIGLDDVRITDVLLHVVRAFPNEPGQGVTHVEETVDPIRDIDIIETELIEKDKELITSLINQKERSVDMNIGGAEANFEFDTLVKVRDLLFGGSYWEQVNLRRTQMRSRAKGVKKLQESMKEKSLPDDNFVPVPIRFAKWTSDEIEILIKHQFFTAKQMIIVLNTTKRDAINQFNPQLDELLFRIREKGYSVIVPICVIFEKNVLSMKKITAARSLATAGKANNINNSGTGNNVNRLPRQLSVRPQEVVDWLAYQDANPTHTSSLNNVIEACYTTLKYIRFYTVTFPHHSAGSPDNNNNTDTVNASSVRSYYTSSQFDDGSGDNRSGGDDNSYGTTASSRTLQSIYSTSSSPLPSASTPVPAKKLVYSSDNLYHMTSSKLEDSLGTAGKGLGDAVGPSTGGVSVVSWNLRQDTMVIEAAALLHTEVERGFICTEVVSADDVSDAAGDEGVLRRQGKLRQEGRGYIVNNGDVITFKFHPGELLSKV